MWTKAAMIRVALAALLFIGFMNVYHISTVQGEQSEPKVVLMRLEDIGPGGQYASVEQLGKLRAVFEYLAEHHVPYQIAVIARWYNVLQNQTIYDKSIGNLDDPYIQAFVQLLQYAQSHGGVVGMHGYTHQYGTEYRRDGMQESGSGNELNVKEAPDTSTHAYAEQRIQAGLVEYRKAGLQPRFWETPHYHIAPHQMDVIRSYFGLIYESIPGHSGQSFVATVNTLNQGFGNASWGSVHVPTPYSFIPSSRDERIILDQLSRNKKLPSFFYHPFLEFKHLTSVTDVNGQPVIRDGMPEFVYPDKEKSNLQKLIKGMRDKGYTFSSILDQAPFIPAQTVKLDSPKDARTRIGDVTGDGEKDFISWNEATGDVTVRPGQFHGMRNEEQPKPAVFLKLNKQKDDLFALLDDDGDGKDDLWVVRSGGKVESYHSTGQSFVFAQSRTLEQTRDWGELYLLRQPGGDWLLAGSSKDRSQLQAIYIHNGLPQTVPPLKWKSDVAKNLQVGRLGSRDPEHFWLYRHDLHALFKLTFDTDQKKWQVHKSAIDLPIGDGDELKIGDYNGDGREDALVWNPKQISGTVFLGDGSDHYRMLSKFGPMGRANSRLMVQDFDGNGKSDIGFFSPSDGTLDVALSFQIGMQVHPQ